MGRNSSYLSNAKYGYDFVVATTQESINAGLVEYLSDTNQPATSLCFLMGSEGVAGQVLGLDELMKRTNGINPFNIPDGTPSTDPRIQTLAGQRFYCGIELQIGIPPGYIIGGQISLPEPIINLEPGRQSAIFNMYCASVRVVMNTPPGGPGDEGSWNVYSQPDKGAWYAQTTVDLSMTGLARDLNTEFFNNRPQWKAHIQSSLGNLSSTAFTLQQLLVDLDSAILQSPPRYNVADPTILAVLTAQFVNIWSANAKLTGAPLLALHVVPQDEDPSPLHLKALERWNSPLIDAAGQVIPLPTPEQRAATTLNYLCSAKSSVPPIATALEWNWLEPSDVSQHHGVLSINRNTIAQFLVGQWMSFARNKCPKFKPVAGRFDLGAGFQGLDIPSISYPAEGPIVAYMYYLNDGQSWGKDRSTVILSADVAMNIQTKFRMDFYMGPTGQVDVGSGIAIQGNNETIIAVQTQEIYIYYKMGDELREYTVVRKTTATGYTFFVDNRGALKVHVHPSTTADTPEQPDSSTIGRIINFYANDVKKITELPFPEMSFDGIPPFIFPGAMAFDYMDPTFSEHQDLTVWINYRLPSDSIESTKKASNNKKRIALSMADVSTIVHEINKQQVTNDKQAILHATSFGEHKIETLPELPSTANFNKSTLQEASITCTSELMQNYIQAELVAPQGEFEAVQTHDGHSLLFATSTSSVLNLFEEKSGHSETGWVVHDLSGHVTDTMPGSSVAEFAVGQSVLDAGSIGLAMAVRNRDSDILYFSLLNSNTNLDWTVSPNWISCPYDGEESLSTMQIAKIFFTETEQNSQWIFVDLVQDSNKIVRYFVNPSEPQGSKWKKHQLPFNLEVGRYQSCVGRISKQYVDGIYSGGAFETAAQLAYVPLRPKSGSGPPMARHLDVPNGVPVSAIAATRNGQHDSAEFGLSELYAVAGTTLYRWSANEQSQQTGNSGIAIMDTAVLGGTDRLVAVHETGVVTLFGRNGSDQVYYTSCSEAELTNSNAWSSPLPILSGIEKITAFVNVKDGSNTIFAAGGGNLSRIVQSTNSSGKLWVTQQIHLQSPPLQPSIPFKSYTTTVKVVPAEGLSGDPISVQISASLRVPAYILGIYYILSDTPINVVTDRMGQLDIVLATDSLVCPLLTLTVMNSMTKFDPAKGSWNQLAKITDTATLRSASLRSSTVGGGVWHSTPKVPLISADVNESDAQDVVTSLQGLTNTYTQLSPAGGPASLAMHSNSNGFIRTTNKQATIQSFSVEDFFHAAGDLFSSIKAGVGKFVKIVIDEAGRFYHFVCEIAGKIWKAVLDTTHAILGALEFVFEKIKTGIKALLSFLESLFEWDDIVRCQQIMHNAAKVYLSDMVDQIANFQGTIDTMLDNASAQIATLSGHSDWSGLGSTATMKMSAIGHDPSKNQTSGSQFLANHFRNQASKITVTGNEPTAAQSDPVMQAFRELVQAAENEEQIITTTVERLQSLMKGYRNLSLGEVLQQLVAIGIEGALGTAKVVVDAVLKIVRDIGQAAVDYLDTKVHIPIISEILASIGFSDISFLELITWVSAYGYTTVYKIVHDKAPFPDDSTSTALINAKDLATLKNIVSPSTAMALEHPVDASTSKTMSRSVFQGQVAKQFYQAGHGFSGALQYFSNGFFMAEALQEAGELPWLTRATAASACLNLLSAGLADVLAGPRPIKDTDMAALGKIALATRELIMIALGFGLAGQFTDSAGVARKGAAIAKAILSGISGAVSIYHLTELNDEGDDDKVKGTIIGQSATITSAFSALCYLGAVNDPDELTKTVLATIMSALNLTFSALRAAQAAITYK